MLHTQSRSVLGHLTSDALTAAMGNQLVDSMTPENIHTMKKLSHEIGKVTYQTQTGELESSEAITTQTVFAQ